MDSAIKYINELLNNPSKWITTSVNNNNTIVPTLTIDKILIGIKLPDFIKPPYPISPQQDLPHHVEEEPLPISNEKTSSFPRNDSREYSNIRWSNRAGRTTQNDTTNPNLLNDINTAAKQAGIIVTITTAKEGHNPKSKSGFISRHSNDLAVDIAIINNKAVQYVKNDADKFANILMSMGYSRNKEAYQQKAVLWQMADHYDHLHISNKIK